MLLVSFYISYQKVTESVLAEDNTKNKKKCSNAEKTQKKHNIFVEIADVSKIAKAI